ncbi:MULTISPECIES: hypothetical protein [Lysobacter]|uniref:hypothetical protein n=1 Tax=Lysobacter TaxID=68 RepID=UPI001F35E721|nr:MULTISPECIES: hypothetical protein [Lysobacter]UJB19074.1 hypothetical protein L1A79_22630 [Lysobacter capsici]UJQ27201.1 hypothetical protein L2D09_17255 [Lysobacter gummosus]
MLIRNRTHYAVAAALVAALALAGCKKKEEPAPTPPPAAETPAPAPAPAEPAPAPAATASVASVDLGSAIGADKKVTAAATSFKPKDTIYASVSTSTSDPAATVPTKLGAKWTFQDGQTVHEEPVADVQATNGGVTAFQINSPKGFPEGKYKVEITQDGNVVQTKEFDVKK